MSTALERNRVERELLDPVRTIELGVEPYFRVRKSWPEIQNILQENGLPSDAYDPVYTPPDVKEQCWEDIFADKDGMFTFEPKKLILGHSEPVHIPNDEFWIMRPYFDTVPKIMTRLLTNFTASWLKPGSSGPQTYEIENTSDRTVSINIRMLRCLVDVFEVTPNALQGDSQGSFHTQEVGKIKLGYPTRW